MLFNSLQFLVFFPVVVFIYFMLPYKQRIIFLLIASYYFYMTWNAKYIVLILFSTFVAYICAILIDKTEHQKKRKYILLINIIISIGILFIYKYFNFFSTSLSDILNYFSIGISVPSLQLILPVGISFYTFHTLCYTIDVYRKKILPEKDFKMFALYGSFFPLLVAGPIERAGNLLPQFYMQQNFDYKRVTDGLKLMLWGFFKKIVIADRLAILVNHVYNDPTHYTGIPLIIATIFFVFQLYCDFSGYTDIAIGSAQVLGIRLMDNFKRPLHSKSVAEFWRRWHISLSTWFQDYVFLPLYFKISRMKSFSALDERKRHNLSFIISTFIGLTLLGLWHGANWTFVVFGVYFALLIVVYHLTKSYWDKMNRFIQISLTFMLVSIGFIFFRANSIGDAIYIIFHLFTKITLNFQGADLGIGWIQLMIMIMSVMLLELVHLLQAHMQMRRFLDDKPLFLRWMLYIIVIFSILFFGIFEKNNFIYFQF